MPGSEPTGSQLFSKEFEVRWADLDANRHVRNTAYLEYATHVRFAYLETHGFPARRFGELNLGPVIFKEEIRFLKEVGQNELLTIDYRLAASTSDASRFRLRHRVSRADGALAAEITTDGGWMDLTTRRLTQPPAELRAAMDGLVRTDDFEEI